MVPPASRGEPRRGSVPPARRGNLKEGVFNRLLLRTLTAQSYGVRCLGTTPAASRLRTGSLFESPLVEAQLCLRADARALPIRADSVDAIVTDIPYADMIRYSDLPADLSTIEDYDAFLDALAIAFDEMARVLKPNRYCAIFVADYRIARSRVILPLHADVIGLMQARGFDLFDLYVWRYYRSGGFRPFGAKPYQAMNVHSYILVFHKPVAPKALVKNRPVRYRHRLIEKLQKANGVPDEP